jgi:sensor histidine kinase YesM
MVYMIRITSISIICLVAHLVGFAQKKDTVFLNGSAGKEYAAFAETWFGSIDVSKTSDRIQSMPNFVSKLNNEKLISRDKSYWIELVIKNTSNVDTAKLIYYCGQHLYIDVYTIDINNDTTKSNFGWMNQNKNSDLYFAEFAIPICIRPNEYKKLIVCCNSYMRSTTLTSVIFSRSSYNQYYERKLGKLSFSKFVFSGVTVLLVFLCIMSIVQLMITKEKIFLYWSIYLFSNFLMVVRIFEITFDYRIISHLLKDYFFYDVAFTSTIQITYALFVFEFLNLSVEFKKSYAAIKIYNWCLVGTIFLSLICYYFIGPWTISNNFFLIPFVVSFIFLLVIIFIQIRFNKLKALSRILVTGALISLIGSLFTVYLTTFGTNLFKFISVTPFDFYIYGVFFELLFFFLALTFRQRSIEKEANKIKVDYTKNIEMELEKRTAQLQIQTSILEEQKLENIRMTHNQEIAVLTEQSLKAQMNPHFIFNVLNSINQFIWENDKPKASLYLTHFSSLVRMILENSGQSVISLKRDLEALKLYVTMENMRFEDKFEYLEYVSDDIDAETIMIPPLIIQPFVENAIWHGFMTKESPGSLRVSITRISDNRLQIVIHDNGVGREAAKKLKSKSALKTKSFGMQITNDRIDLLNKLYNFKNKATIEDLYDGFGNPSGTTVVITLSIKSLV